MRWWIVFSGSALTAVVALTGLFAVALLGVGSSSCLAEVSARSIHPPEVVARFVASDSTQANMVKPVLLADGRLLGLSVSVAKGNR